MNQNLSHILLFDITDVTRQLGIYFEHIYCYDAKVFVGFLLDQELTMSTLHLSSCLHLIAYRKYLGNGFAKATATHVFSIARRNLLEYMSGGFLPQSHFWNQLTNDTPHLRLFSLRRWGLFLSALGLYSHHAETKSCTFPLAGDCFSWISHLPVF